MTGKIFQLFLLGLIMVSGCREDEQNRLFVSPRVIEFQDDGGIAKITIETDAASWQITNPASDWLILSNNQGTQKKLDIGLTVISRTIEPRVDTLIVSAGDANPVEVIVSQPSSEYLYFLTSTVNQMNFKRAGNSFSLNINTDAPLWNIIADVDWIQFNTTQGGTGSNTITVTAQANPGEEPRTANITLSAEYAQTINITVSQLGALYPGYNTSPAAPDATGMSSTASQLAAKIILGWNIGNSLEAIGGETAWGNPLITKALIDTIKQSGFNAIRLPCSWNQHMANSTTAQLKTDWLNRVKQVVQYCVDNEMYVLLNIHWDGGWLENNCTPDKQGENNEKQKAFWEQIATHLRDFDEHLLFASANEPNVENATQMAVLNSYHQTFINAVRSTGGRNSYRVLVVQGPSTDITKTNQLMNVLPTDEIANRLMVEIHYYTPWNFCGLTEDASWGKMFYYWGNGYHSATDTERNAAWGEESTVDANFTLMRTKFVQKGIPVILGEYSVTRRSSLTGDNLTTHLASRAYWVKYVTKQARANGILPFYWDNGHFGNYGCAIFNRTNNTVVDQQVLDALMQGINE
ncbi:MAG: cellulase family glycosylhydrolase [Bacteroidales bacterium]|nr:cellulase family glycosylhydrolase [Bacteroidales bacterium]